MALTVSYNGTVSRYRPSKRSVADVSYSVVSVARRTSHESRSGGDRPYKWPLGALAFHQLVEQGSVREVDLLDGGERLGDERVESGLGDEQGWLILPQRLDERLYRISAELSTSQPPFNQAQSSMTLRCRARRAHLAHRTQILDVLHLPLDHLPPQSLPFPLFPGQALGQTGIHQLVPLGVLVRIHAFT